jgi:hypothetical protein
MVQSEFNLVLWFVSYNIFSLLQMVGPRLQLSSLSPPSLASAGKVRPQHQIWRTEVHSGCFSSSRCTRFLRETDLHWLRWRCTGRFTGSSAGLTPFYSKSNTVSMTKNLAGAANQNWRSCHDPERLLITRLESFT